MAIRYMGPRDGKLSRGGYENMIGQNSLSHREVAMISQGRNAARFELSIGWLRKDEMPGPKQSQPSTWVATKTYASQSAPIEKPSRGGYDERFDYGN